MKTGKNMNDGLPPDKEGTAPETDELQLSFCFSAPHTNSQQLSQQLRRNKSTKVLRLGHPAIPVGITQYGTQVAKLDHIWRAARTYARQNNYKLLEMTE